MSPEIAPATEKDLELVATSAADIEPEHRQGRKDGRRCTTTRLELWAFYVYYIVSKSVWMTRTQSMPADPATTRAIMVFRGSTSDHHSSRTCSIWRVMMRITLLTQWLARQTATASCPSWGALEMVRSTITSRAEPDAT